MIHQVIPGTAEFLMKAPVAGYLGVDPTGDSMHIGNLVPVMMMVHFQRAGHHPILLVGGATAMVGDPSGKDKERQLKSIEEIQANAAGIRKQLEHFLDFDTQVNPARLVNNYDWLGKMDFLTFLRDVGKHLTINYMMSKESVKKRMSGDTGISYTEFAYQLLQGYDYLHLYQHEGARIQVGGSDQWGNITTGTELIRRKLGSESEAYAAVCPLLTREDGSKFGKTAEGKSVWLSAEKTSPYEFYQYWLNLGDLDAASMIKIFTLKDQTEIAGLIADHESEKHLRKLQIALAEDITLRLHGEAGLASAKKLTEFLFNKNATQEALAALEPKDWQEVAQVADKLQVPKDRLVTGVGILDLLLEVGVVKSKGEARRAIEKDRSIRVNAIRVEDATATIDLSSTFYETYFQIQKGKKNRYIVELV